MKTLIRSICLAALFSVALLLSACGGGSKSGSGGILSGGASPANSGGAIVSMLAQVPDKGDLRKSIQFTNYAKLRDAGGIKAPSGTESVAELADYWQKVFDSGVLGLYLTDQLSGYQMPANITSPAQVRQSIQAYMDQFGYNIGMLDQDMMVESEELGHRRHVMRGRFDLAKVEAAVQADTTVFREQLQKIPYNGRTIYSWGEDGKQNLRERSAPRPLGAGGRLTVNESSLLFTNFTDDIYKMIDASAKKTRSLADVEELRLLAGKLEGLPVYQGQLHMEDYSLRGEVGKLVRESYGKDAAGKKLIDDFAPNALKEFTAVATGHGKDAKGTFGVLVYVHRDEAAATVNEGRLKALLAKPIVFDSRGDWAARSTSSQLTREGRLLTLQLWSKEIDVAHDICNYLDTLCLWQ